MLRNFFIIVFTIKPFIVMCLRCPAIEHMYEHTLSCAIIQAAFGILCVFYLRCLGEAVFSDERMDDGDGESIGGIVGLRDGLEVEM